LIERPGVAAVDPTHVLIETTSVGLTGFQADDWLRDQRHIDVELADHRRVMPLVTFAHGEQRSTGWCARCATSSTSTANPAPVRMWRRCRAVPSCAPSRRCSRVTRSSRRGSSSSRAMRSDASAPSS